MCVSLWWLCNFYGCIVIVVVVFFSLTSFAPFPYASATHMPIYCDDQLGLLFVLVFVVVVARWSLVVAWLLAAALLLVVSMFLCF